MQNQYAFALDLYRDDGAPLGQRCLTPDWAPALEWVYVEGVRAGALAPVIPANPTEGPGRIEPVWHPVAGQPYVGAFRVVLPAKGDGMVTREIPTAYVRGLARRASEEFVEKGVLQRGDTFCYLVSAFPAAHNTGNGAATAVFAIEEVPHEIPLTESSLEVLLRGSVSVDDAHTKSDLPVFIPQRVLDEVTELARQAREVETGGVLVGLLHRDASIPEILVEVTAQIPAPHTEAHATKLTFSKETWAAVRAALALRRRGELMVGWWHFHPAPCVMNNCPPEKRAQCVATSAFFSADDITLHRTLFPRAYNTALLVSDGAASGLRVSLFGWHEGMVMSRGYYVHPDARESTE